MTKALVNRLIGIFLIGHRKLGQQYSCFFEGLLWKIGVEDSIDCFESGGVISKNNLEGQQSHNVQ